jgi:hypothetical protein
LGLVLRCLRLFAVNFTDWQSDIANAGDILTADFADQTG